MPDLLAQYGVAVVFAWAFAVQAGLPLPAAPVLLGAGALSGLGRMNLALAVASSGATSRHIKCVCGKPCSRSSGEPDPERRTKILVSPVSTSAMSKSSIITPTLVRAATIGAT